MNEAEPLLTLPPIDYRRQTFPSVHRQILVIISIYPSVHGHHLHVPIVDSGHLCPDGNGGDL